MQFGTTELVPNCHPVDEEVQEMDEVGSATPNLTKNSVFIHPF
jgi:hypothetical protein